MPRWRGLFAFAIVAGCSPTPDKFALVQNRCQRDADCRVQSNPDDKNPPVCNIVRERCEHATAQIPYPLVLQVNLTGDRGPLVPRSTLTDVTLESSDDAKITVPLAVEVRGAIRAPSRPNDGQPGKFIAAAITLTPVPATPGYPVSPETTYTGISEGDAENNVRVALDPETVYDVLIQPLRDDSEQLPPIQLRGRQYPDDDARLDFDYPQPQTVQLRLLDPQNEPLVNAFVRLTDRSSGAVISSTNRSDADGMVTLFAQPDRLLLGFEVMLGVARTTGSPWLVQVRADPLRLLTGVMGADDQTPTLIVPKLPDEVTYEGRLEMPPNLDATLVDPSELVFVSSFPVGSGTNVGDWCRATRTDDPLPPFACSAQISVTTDPNGQFSLSLLPGSYRIFARPSGASATGQEVRTSQLEKPAIVRSPGDSLPQTGQVVQLKDAVSYRGRVVTPDRRLNPGVTVRAEALEVTSNTGMLDEVADYARSIEALTDGDGNFRIGVDVGYYDLSLRPPAETGFAWSYITNRLVRESDPGGSLGDLVLQSPLVYAGRVLDPDEKAVPNATVDAYAVIRSLDGTSRAVRVASTQVAPDGKFELLLPPSVAQTSAPAASGE